MKGTKPHHPTREERLAAALRENLKRRKARDRALTNAPAGVKAKEAEGEGRQAPASRHPSATKRG